eukprot:760000-Hanusia_phi.AAC.2
MQSRSGWAGHKECDCLQREDSLFHGQTSAPGDSLAHEDAREYEHERLCTSRIDTLSRGAKTEGRCCWGRMGRLGSGKGSVRDGMRGCAARWHGGSDRLKAAAGTRGFWKDYPNIENLVSELGIPEDEVFTDFTGSSFYSPYGLEATAPVFSSSSLPQLPSPLGQVFATFTNFKRIPVSDRTTMLGLLYSILDFARSDKTFEAYDRMTAHELFIRMGVSKRLVDDFIRPTLLVGLFKPPEELSAAVAMELLYFYALAHQTSFDVRWIKQKSIAEVLINPLANKLIDEHGLQVRSKTFVKEVRPSCSLYPRPAPRRLPPLPPVFVLLPPLLTCLVLFCLPPDAGDKILVDEASKKVTGISITRGKVEKFSHALCSPT